MVKEVNFVTILLRIYTFKPTIYNLIYHRGSRVTRYTVYTVNRMIAFLNSNQNISDSHLNKLQYNYLQ